MKIILLIVIFSCYVKQKYMVSRDMVFPDELNRFCPLSSFCENEPDTSSNTSSSKSFENEATVMMPCCEECSCSKECGRKRNCCRYEHDFYRLEETLETVCMQLTTLSTGPQQPFYHIIDKCSNRSQTCNTLSTSTLGRFFPVYSRASGMLYYNPKCAGCHGQIDKDLIEFRPLIMCQSLSVSYFTAVSSVTNGSDVPSCNLHFLPPDDIDLSTEFCYPGLKRDCDPYMKNSELIEGLCKAFNATFHDKERYAQFGNVYCFLCNAGLSFGDSLDGWNERYVNCPGMEIQRMFGLSFAVLLDTSSIDDSKVSTADRRQVELPIWCDSSENQGACRAVHCPEGRVYSGGVCKVLGDKWYFKSARINIKLTSPTGYQTVPTSELLSINTDDPKNSSSFTYVLERPGFENWDVILLYNAGIDNATVSYFVAMLFFKYTTFSPNQFVDMTERSLNGLWVLNLQGTVYELKPDIHKYIKYVRFTGDDKIQYVPNWHYDPRAFPIDLDRVADVIKIVTTGNVNFKAINRDAFFISKLFFCNLVELLEEEVINHTGRILVYRVYLANQKRYLTDGEFTEVPVDHEHQRIRVCLYELVKGEGYSNMATIITLTYQFMLLVEFMMALGII